MRKKSIAATVAALALIGAPAAIATGGGANPDHTTVVAGADRYETAAQIALSVYAGDQSTETLYIANGESHIDAITLGANVDPDSSRRLLLVKRDSVPAATRDALQQISHARLVFLGGDDAISPAVRDEVMSLTDNYAYPN